MSTAAEPSTPRPLRRPSPREVAFYTPEQYRPEDNVAYLMRRLLGSVATHVQHELDPRGLTNAQWVPLYKLHLGHGTTAAELARECQLDAGAMTRTLDRLEAKGLVRRVRSLEDRRVVKLELTDAGRDAVSHVPEALCKVVNGYLRGFTRQEWLQLKDMLGRMLANGVEYEQQRREEG